MSVDAARHAGGPRSGLLAAARRALWGDGTGRPPGDFSATPRMLAIAAAATVIGVLAGFLSWALLRLIGFFTNIFFFHRLGTSLVSPADASIGAFVLVVPVAGGLIVGVMARFGSDRIRGHGIPEALESILVNGSRMQPKVALLKPLSAAISIGSGGPFGAEGPIIMTGGAAGSIVAQFFHLTDAERKTLLVAGAAGGMAATFAAPVAAVLLAVELLLFEWKPRSLVPVALASATAMATRHYLLGNGPLFPTAPTAAFAGPGVLAACVLAGVLATALAAALTAAVYASEDAFRRLPIHWMWWPAIGGVIIGVGGLIFPKALGVGYANIGALLGGDTSLRLVLGILIVKSLIWSGSLGSGTSGGVLAPLLMIGAALGGLEAHVFPDQGAGFWPMVGMAAMLAAAMGAPLTAVVFSLELTHDVNALTPLLIASGAAYGLAVLVMRRSILTEKVSRRGYHLSREYAVDPLETTRAGEVMRTDVAVLAATLPLDAVAAALRATTAERPHTQHLYPIVDDGGTIVGVATRDELRELAAGDAATPDGRRLGESYRRTPVVAFADEPLRVVAGRMADTGFTRMPVVQRDRPAVLAGMISLNDLLAARARTLDAERERRRVLRLRWFVPRRRARASGGDPPEG
ncbi:MAG TPA: chloride channel protein [Dehalococcoidia bacterium]|nr:chloride channel protein [Dehalococcoidia bacterium]